MMCKRTTALLILVIVVNLVSAAFLLAARFYP